MTTQADLSYFFKHGMSQKAVDDICASHHKGNKESVAANRSVAKVAQKKRILEALRLWGQATCDRIEVETGLSHQSCSARFAELKRDGLIRKVGTAPTRSGCNAAVYQAVFP